MGEQTALGTPWREMRPGWLLCRTYPWIQLVGKAVRRRPWERLDNDLEGIRGLKAEPPPVEAAQINSSIGFPASSLMELAILRGRPMGCIYSSVQSIPRVL